MSSTTAEPTSRIAGLLRVFRAQEMGLVAVALILCIGLSIAGEYSPSRYGNAFLNFDNLFNGVATPMSIFAIMAVGMTFVIITGGIDISIASIFAVSALGTAWLLQSIWPLTRGDAQPSALWVLPVAILVPPLIGLMCGLVNGILVVSLRMHPFIVTLATLGIFRGLAVVTLSPQTTLPSGANNLPHAFTQNFMTYEFAPGLRLMPMIIMLIVVTMGWIYLRLTVAGRENYAIGGNEEASRYSGLRVGRIKLRVYALAGLCAGIAAMVHLGRFGSASTNTLTGGELSVIAAAVVGGASLTGGRGTALGAILGALVIRLIENGIDILRLNQEYSRIIIGVAILLAVSIDQVSSLLRNRQQLGGAGRRGA